MNRRIVWVSVILVALAACTKASTPSIPKESGTSPAESPPAATSPASSPNSISGGGLNYYDCSTLLSDKEARDATGVPSMSLFNQEHGNALKGQTYCQFFGEQGAVSMAVSVLTGPAFQQLSQLAAAAQGLPNIPGIGDEAKWSDQGAFLGARVGKIGLTVVFTSMSGGKLDVSDPKGAAVAVAKIVISRV